MIDIDNYTIVPLFSKVVACSNLNLNNSEIKRILDILKTIKMTKVNDSGNLEAAHTSIDLNVLENKKLLFLKKKILNSFMLFKNNVLHCENDFKIITSWIALTKKEEHTQNFHKHTNCFYSGILYIKTPENCGDIEFRSFNDKNFDANYKETNIFNAESWFFKPIESRILFFPSETWHSVKRNKSNEDRISIAFNFFPVGKIGNKDSQANLSLKL